MIAYFNGRYLPKDEIALSPDDRGFLFADGLYEVARSYQGRLFALDAHLRRLSYGAEHLRFPRTDFSELGEVCTRLLADNQLQNKDALLYIQVTRGAPPVRLHHFPPADTPLTVYAAAKAFQPDPALPQKGAAVVLVPDQRWARCDLKTVGLTANVLAAQQAQAEGVLEALLVRDGCVMEASHSSFLIARRGTVIAPPLSNYILGSITRQAVERLCAQEAIPFRAEPIFLDRLSEADELMLAGTTLEVTPVVQVKGIARTWTPGPLTRRLQTAFRTIV